MNLIDGIVLEVLQYEVKKSSELWELDKNEEDKEHHIYTVRYLDEGGENIKKLWFNFKNNNVKKGYKFLH